MWRRGRDSNPRSPPSSAATTPPATTCDPYRAEPATASDCARWEHGIRRELRRSRYTRSALIQNSKALAGRIPGSATKADSNVVRSVVRKMRDRRGRSKVLVLMVAGEGLEPPTQGL